MALGQAYEQNLAWDPFSELRNNYKKIRNETLPASRMKVTLIIVT